METRTSFITIDSRDRNTTSYPDPNDYVYHLDDTIKNIISVELVYAVYLKYETETYVNLHIEEFSPNAISNNHILRDSFIQLPLLDYINEYTPNRFRSIKKFYNPINKLGRLTIKFYKYDGTLYEINDHLLKFEIKYHVYDGQIQSNLFLNSDLTTNKSMIDLKLPKNFTKNDLNIEYLKKKKMCQSDNERQILKLKYLELKHSLN